MISTQLLPTRSSPSSSPGLGIACSSLLAPAPVRRATLAASTALGSSSGARWFSRVDRPTSPRKASKKRRSSAAPPRSRAIQLRAPRPKENWSSIAQLYTVSPTRRKAAAHSGCSRLKKLSRNTATRSQSGTWSASSGDKLSPSRSCIAILPPGDFRGQNGTTVYPPVCTGSMGRAPTARSSARGRKRELHLQSLQKGRSNSQQIQHLSQVQGRDYTHPCSTCITDRPAQNHPRLCRLPGRR